MDNKISINELVDLNKKNIEAYNIYMQYLKDVFRKYVSQIKAVNVVVFDETNNKLGIEVEHADIYENKINYIDIIKVGDNIEVIVTDKNKQYLKEKIKKDNQILNDIFKFCKDNEFMKTKNARGCMDDKKVLIDLHPDVIVFNYEDGGDKFKFLYELNEHVFRTSKRDDIVAIKIKNRGNVYYVIPNENFNSRKFDEVLNLKIIDKNDLPEHLNKSTKTLTKKRG